MWVLLCAATPIPTPLHFRGIQQLGSACTYVKTQTTVQMKTQSTLFFLIVVVFFFLPLLFQFKFFLYFTSTFILCFRHAVAWNTKKCVCDAMQALPTKNYAKKKMAVLIGTVLPKIKKSILYFSDYFSILRKHVRNWSGNCNEFSLFS